MLQFQWSLFFQLACTTGLQQACTAITDLVYEFIKVFTQRNFQVKGFHHYIRKCFGTDFVFLQC